VANADKLPKPAADALAAPVAADAPAKAAP